jgi:hypothetical protein
MCVTLCEWYNHVIVAINMSDATLNFHITAYIQGGKEGKNDLRSDATSLYNFMACVGLFLLCM